MFGISFRTHTKIFSCPKSYEFAILKLYTNVAKGGDNEALVVGEPNGSA